MAHECPRPTCTKQVRDDYLACRPHWFELPHANRLRVWRHWNSGDVMKHAEAVADASSFWQTKAAQEVSGG